MAKNNGTARPRSAVVAVAVVALLATVTGCPDGSLLRLVDDDGDLGTDARLGALTVSVGELSPAFDPMTTAYIVRLNSAHSSIVVTGTPVDSRSTVSADNGVPLGLEAGANNITITVTAEDGSTTKAYVVTVNRGAVGALDPSFDAWAMNNSDFRAAAVQSDGRIVIGGYFLNIGGVFANLLRLEPDGSVDTTSDLGDGPSGEVEAIAVQADGKILIGGLFTAVDGVPRNRIARLNVDGSLDTDFDPGAGADSAVYTLGVQPGGKIIIGGSFAAVDGVARNRIARLNADGSLDTAFEPGNGANSTVLTLAVQPDGKTVIGGRFTEVDGLARNHITRVNSNGSIDTSFFPGTALGDNEWVSAVALDAAGRIIAGGGLVLAGEGSQRSFIARFGPDGAVDSGFFRGVNQWVDAVIVQADGKIIIGGSFTAVHGVPRNRIARLNTDGSLDTAFDPGTGANGTVSTVAVQPDGMIVLAGLFTSLDGWPRYRIARLW